jgi:hypothetical protein
MTTHAVKPAVHLWIYNHPINGISDQIEFFFLVMQQHGYPVTISRKPRLDALNVVIENFSEASSQELIDFCEQTGKRVAIIMTEHLDLIEGELVFHGERLGTSSDYMHPANQMARIKNLMDCITYIRCFLVLGDLPQLIGADRMFPGVACRFLPFPKLDRIRTEDGALENDLAFTGALTAFRKDLLDKLRQQFTVGYPSHFLSRHGRDRFNQTSRIVLNVPQRPGWKWLSLMRIIAALRCGRASVSVETCDTSHIAQCCVQLPIQEFEAKIGDFIANWQDTYSEMFDRYETMRQHFASEHPFPADIFGYWALLERRHLATAGRAAIAAIDETATATAPIAV